MNLTIIDVSGWIHRHFHGNPKIARADGVEVGAVHGCGMALWNLLRTNPAHICAAYDHGKITWRNEAYADYKAHRPPIDEALRMQIPMIYRAVEAFGVTGVSAPGYEADDVIATLAKKALDQGLDVTIVSSDKDLMQLITEHDSIPAVRLYDPLKYTMIDPADVQAKFGILPSQMGDLLALWGDAVDNVPGVPGIGPKIGSGLLNKFGNLNAILAAAADGSDIPKGVRSKLCLFANEARLSRTLVTLKDDAPVDLDLDALRVNTPDSAKVASFCEEMQLRTLRDAIFGQAAA